MNAVEAQRHRLSNGLQSVALIGAMAALLGLLGWIFAGGGGVVVALVMCVLVAVFGPRLSPRLVLRLYRARPIQPYQAPDLYRTVDELGRRAGLSQAPTLYYLPTPVLNAFAVGSRQTATIALTDGLLRNLAPRELVGVLAHELSHVRHNDMWVMNLADIISRMTIALSQVGLLLLLFGLPLVLFGIMPVSLPALLLLLLAPTLSAVLQLALSRTREFNADVGAIELTNDPRGLASALQKLERYQRGWLEQIFMPGRRVPEPGWLRTHPPTEERIRRLLALAPRHPPRRLQPNPAQWLDQARLWPVPQRPRWHWHGLWF